MKEKIVETKPLLPTDHYLLNIQLYTVMAENWPYTLPNAQKRNHFK
jgi:hypothetical protein